MRHSPDRASAIVQIVAYLTGALGLGLALLCGWPPGVVAGAFVTLWLAGATLAMVVFILRD